MSNPLSLHVSDPGRRDGFGAWLERLNQAGWSAPVLYAVNANLTDDIKRYSPQTKWIYRLQNETFERLPGDFLQGDPRANARKWLLETKDNSGRNQIQTWLLNPADWYDPLNEPVIGTPMQATWLNEWMLEALIIASEYGVKLALFSFSTGSPDYALWPYLLTSLQLGKSNGAILSLHAYNDGGLAERDENGNLTQAALDTAFRHRKIYATLPDNAKLPVVYTEASADNGYGMRPASEWIADLIAYGEIIKDDPIVLGACAFQIGGNESNCYSIVGDYAEEIVEVDWTVEPVIPDDYVFLHWLMESQEITINPFEFNMPDRDIALIAVYVKQGEPPIYRRLTLATNPAGFENRVIANVPTDQPIEVGKLVRVEAR